MRKVFLLLIAVLPSFLYSQQEYSALFTEATYAKPSFVSIFRNDEYREYKGGLGFEHYFRSGIKLSGAVNFVYGHLPYSEGYSDNPLSTVQHWGFKGQLYNLEVPILFGYNFLKKSNRVQWFFYAGYSWGINLKTINYNYQNHEEFINYSRNKKNRSDLLAGTEVRVWPTEKWYLGVSYILNENIFPGYALSNYDNFSLKAGIKLFQ